jgi:hypothetical protein
LIFNETRGDGIDTSLHLAASPWTPDTARTEAKRLLGLVASGEDPLSVGRRSEGHVSELSDLYFAEGATHKKPSTLKADRARIVHHIKPLLGRRRVDQLTRADIERLMVEVGPGPPSQRKGTYADRGAFQLVDPGQQRSASR